MVKQKITSPSGLKDPLNGFKGFNFIKLLVSLERPLIAILATLIPYMQTQNPALAGVIGASGTLIYSALKYFVKEYKQ